MKQAFIEWSPTQRTLSTVKAAEQIINKYEDDGYTLTVRQLYYQFVSRDLIENSERSYKKLANIITKARMAGMLSWLSIEDRSRHCNRFWFDENVLNPIKELPRYIRFDRWKRQPYYVEVWVEKDALSSVISKACNPFLVPYMACKGYLSTSEAWRAGQRYLKNAHDGKECILIHLGDHDPSGIDMTRDNGERLNLYTQISSCVKVKRIALNMNQIEKFKPPPNPAKVTDSRANKYIQMYGRASWELDALEPNVIKTMIQDEIKQYIDFNIWKETGYEQDKKRSILERVYDRWEEIIPIIDAD
jgi:hypothetical protein